MKLIFLFLGTFFILLSACTTQEIKAFREVDPTRNSREITIGTQVWMTENLGVDYFRNGDPIPQVGSMKEWKKAGKNQKPAWCYYKNKLENGAKYGKLYNWYAVNDLRGLAPEGWHIPTDNEWKLLSNYLGGEDFAGKKMKSTSGWYDFDGNENGAGTNESGFNGLPGGCLLNDGFDFLGSLSYWWSASEDDSDYAYNRFLYHDYDALGRSSNYKEGGFSVRCLRD
jgi:uncharacterized protein (TIGR02145 family)